MASLLRPALLLFATLSVLTALAYPVLVTALAQALLPGPASGSLLRDGERALGSALIGQAFANPAHFWSRPSATGPVAYNAAASTGSNQGPSNPALHDAVRARIESRDLGLLGEPRVNVLLLNLDLDAVQRGG